MKCIDYKQFSVLCQGCDIKSDIKCCKKFNFDIPQKYINVESQDHLRVNLNKCPTCGNSIGYHPKDKNFRCPICEQKILWE